MGSHCEACFENASRTTVSVDCCEQTTQGLGKPIIFSASPGDILKIDIDFDDFNFYRFTITTEDNSNNNYYEVRSVADFLLLQQALIKKYNLKLNSARPDYRDFW
ncbi:MAG: hypothetical protein JSW06_00575 [Thermoplasmatales archaeon]|nr:MAG: hypothetical protein JSW06_00575 [Thermoplasmatales archaeon]